MPCSVKRRRSTAPKEIRLLGTRQGVIFRPMLAALRSRRVEKLPDQVVLRGRILFMAEDADLVRRQLEGEDIDWRAATKLRDNFSTDEIRSEERRVGKEWSVRWKEHHSVQQ